MTRSTLSSLAPRERRMHPRRADAATHASASAPAVLAPQSTSNEVPPRPPPDRAASTNKPPQHSTRELVHLLRTHNHHLTLVSTSRLSSTINPSAPASASASVTPAHSVRSTIPPAPCCFDQCSAAMAPKPASHRAHRANSVYSTPSSGRPSRHPSAMHHRFGKFSPASRRAFNALFSRRLRPRSSDPHHATISTDPGARVTEERLKVLTDENARLRARVVELMSRILCGTADDGLTTVEFSGEGVRDPADILRAEAESGSSSKLHGAILPSSLSASPVVRFSATDSNEVSPPPSRAPSDGVTPGPLISSIEGRLRSEAEGLRVSLDHAAKENERLKKCLTELQERSQREVRSIEEEKEELEEKLCAAREDREVMENELSELREWSKRNIARKEAAIDAVKKEFADTREEVDLLNELLETMRQEQAANRVGAQDRDLVAKEKDISTPHQTDDHTAVVAEETTERPPTNDKVPTEDADAEEASNGVTRVDSSMPASAPLVEETGTPPPSSEHNAAVEKVPEVKSAQEVGAPAPVEANEPPAEERKDEEKEQVVNEEEEITPAPQPVAECSFSITENREHRSSGLALVTKKIQGVDLEKEEEKVREMNEKKLREAELKNPLMNMEREQIIVGHFCGHVVQTVAQLLGKGQELRAKEVQVKELIAQQWAKWVAGSITKVEFIDSLVDWVHSCCDKGAETDVVASFNAWYCAQYTQYKHRAGSDHANGADNGGAKMRRMLSKAETKSPGQSGEGGSNGDGNMVRLMDAAPSGSASKERSPDIVRVSLRGPEVVRRRMSRHAQEDNRIVERSGAYMVPEAEFVTEGDVDDEGKGVDAKLRESVMP